MTKDKFDFLVNEVVVRNGEGHKLLEQLVESNEISKLEETKILITAKIKLLEKKMEAWCEYLD